MTNKERNVPSSCCNVHNYQAASASAKGKHSSRPFFFFLFIVLKVAQGYEDNHRAEESVFSHLRREGYGSKTVALTSGLFFTLELRKVPLCLYKML